MKLCWYCEKSNNDITDGFIGDFVCGFCGIENSVYDKNKPEVSQPTTESEWLQEEDEMGDLKSWSKENAKFIKIKRGESYEGIYQGYKEGVNMNGDPAIIYNFDGKEFKSSSTKLSEIFADITEGTKVRISRQGEGLQTKWTVEKV